HAMGISVCASGKTAPWRWVRRGRRGVATVADGRHGWGRCGPLGSRGSRAGSSVDVGQRGPCPARLRVGGSREQEDAGSSGDRGGRGASGWERQAQQGGEAAGAEPDVPAREIEELLLPRGARSNWRGWWHPEPLARRVEPRGGVEADVADLVEAVGQHVLHEAPEELDGGEGLGGVAAGPEHDARIGDVEQAAVGDADAMGVTAKVGDDVLGGRERRLRVDVPGELRELGYQTGEGTWVAEVVDMRERACVVGVAQPGQDLATKQLAHGLDG